MMVTPWSPIGPETRIASPGRALATPRFTSAAIDADARGVDVAAVGLALLHHLGVPGDHPTPAAAAASRMDSVIRVRSATGKPSSRMKPADRYSGVAPATARSLTVPLIARSPMLPPGKNSGETTNESVVSATVAPPTSQPGGVLQRLEQRVAERVEEDGLDQGLGRLAARPVRHRDALFPELRPPPPGPVDAVEHLLLAARPASCGGPAWCSCRAWVPVCCQRSWPAQLMASGTRLRVIRP